MTRSPVLVTPVAQTRRSYPPVVLQTSRLLETNCSLAVATKLYKTLPDLDLTCIWDHRRFLRQALFLGLPLQADAPTPTCIMTMVPYPSHQQALIRVLGVALISGTLDMLTHQCGDPLVEAVVPKHGLEAVQSPSGLVWAEGEGLLK